LAEFVSLADPDPEELLEELQRTVQLIVPEIVGLSLGLVQDQLTFTLVASDGRTAMLDATQYLDGGPCVEVAEGRADVINFPGDDPLDEERWRFFSEATAARGVASTLSLPLHHEGQLIGGLNLYASTANAFAGRIEQLATLVSAAPTAAVSNADLSFSTRLEAIATPQRMRDRAIIDTALGWVAADRGIDVEAANRELVQAAARAGVRPVDVARVLLSVFTQSDS
jgi:GAF domain-containing protein